MGQVSGLSPPPGLSACCTTPQQQVEDPDDEREVMRHSIARPSHLAVAGDMCCGAVGAEACGVHLSRLSDPTRNYGMPGANIQSQHGVIDINGRGTNCNDVMGAVWLTQTTVQTREEIATSEQHIDFESLQTVFRQELMREDARYYNDQNYVPNRHDEDDDTEILPFPGVLPASEDETHPLKAAVNGSTPGGSTEASPRDTEDSPREPHAVKAKNLPKSDR